MALSRAIKPGDSVVLGSNYELMQGECVPRSGAEQGTLEVGKAMKAHGT